jgi:hypothetical protein
MMPEALALALTGGQRYALAQSAVRAITRHRADAVPTLAELLDLVAGADEDVVLTLHHASIEFPVRVQHIDLRASSVVLSLPPWLAAVVHSAVKGVVLDGDDLLPYIDLAPLAQPV